MFPGRVHNVVTSNVIIRFKPISAERTSGFKADLLILKKNITPILQKKKPQKHTVLLK